MDKEASNQIPIEMEEDAEYQRQLNLFSRSSTEKGIELLKIGEIIAGLSKRRYFLDIGAGSGDLTIPVSQSFYETTIVEPNSKQAGYLKRRCPHFYIYNDFWEKVAFDSKRFDFILCSHVLYYIEEGHWMNTIEKMYDCLEEGGRIAIVLQSPIGEVASFFNHFADYDVNILELWRDLIQRYGDDSIEVRYFLNEIYTDNLDDMVSVGLFLLLDRKYKDLKEQIGNYFEANHKIDGGYHIKQDEILLIIKKDKATRKRYRRKA
jgi:ubiquinone/menaquinone biosynthesis C-methylase UbiE